MNRKHLRTFLAVFVLALFFLSGCTQTNIQHKTHSQQLTVVSMNVRREYTEDTGVRSWEQRKAPLVSYLSDLSADIFCLQEISRDIMLYITRNFPQSYEAYYFEGNLVLYRKDILSAETKGAFYLNHDPTRALKGWDAKNIRNCQYLQFVHLESGAKFTLFNTHFDAHGKTAQYESAVLVSDLFARCKDPFLLCGDLNVQEYTATYHKLSETMLDCRKIAPESDSGITFHNWGRRPDDSGTPIDYCLTSSFGVEAESYTILRDRWSGENFYSDHYAIKCVINIAY